jgi:hypothetical protein
VIYKYGLNHIIIIVISPSYKNEELAGVCDKSIYQHLTSVVSTIDLLLSFYTKNNSSGLTSPCYWIITYCSGRVSPVVVAVTVADITFFA